MGTRPPLSGYNHNIRYKNRVYHVQTEDSGLATPHVFTHLFLEGQIISSARTEYKDLVDDPDNEKKVRKMMQGQHKRLMKQLRRGELDDKIISLVGTLEPEVPAVAEGIPEAVEVPATAEAEVPAMAEADLPAAPMVPAEAPPERPAPPEPDLPPVPLPPVSVTDSVLLSKFPLPDEFPESGPPTGEICPMPPLDEPEPEPPPPAAARPPRQPLRPRPDVEVTEAIDIRALHGLPREEEAGQPAKQGTQPRVSVVVEEFPGDAFLDGQRPEPTTTYSHVYRDKSAEVPAVSGRRRIETPLPMRAKAQRTQPPPVPPAQRPPPRPPAQDQQRRTSRVFGQPLPQSTRFSTPSEEATPVPVPVPIRPRRSGVYLVPGGPPQRPPHPDPTVRRPEARTASSPQRYTAPRASSAGTPKVRKRRQTGAYEIPGPDGARPPSSPAIRPPEARPVPLVKAKGPPRPPSPPASSRPAVPARPARPPSRPAVPVRQAPPAGPPGRPARPPSRPAAPVRATPSQQVVARPVVVVGQPVNVGRPRPRTDRQVPPPEATKPPPAPPPAAPRHPGEPPPRARVPSTVFGSDLISERSLDEVILAYLAEDSEGEE